MKFRSVILAGLIPFLAGQTTENTAETASLEWGPEVDGVQVSVAVNKSIYKKGEPVIMTLWLQNKGPLESFIQVPELFWTYRPELRRLDTWLPGGEAPELTQVGRQVLIERQWRGFSSYLFRVRPSEIRGLHVKLNDYFKLDRAADYTLLLVGPLPGRFNDPRPPEARTGKVVISNRVRFRVVNEEYTPE